MFLTISTTHRPATDLGYLLHKHPGRVQEFGRSFGVSTVFYPEASDERCTAALVLEVDAVKLARTRNMSDATLAQYVNDRSYAASSLLAVALGDVFRTARAGRCTARTELVQTLIPLEIRIPVLPCRGGAEMAERIFAPLGWRVDATAIAFDPVFPAWGDSRYVRLELTGTLRLADALSQLYVLLPALDEAKHYWQGPDEVDKLIREGGGWLAAHPERELITRRYLNRGGLARIALSRLTELDDRPEDAPEAAPTPLRRRRYDVVLDVLRRLGVTSVIDLGCGDGVFVEQLVRATEFTRIAGFDVSTRSLTHAARRLHLDELTDRQAERIRLFQGALTYADDRFAGYDAAVLMEVIEHVDEGRLPALERVVFGTARPGAVLVTTPNREYNALYPGLAQGERSDVKATAMRHPDHRFEWDRAEFAAWCDRVAAAYGYRVERSGIGEADERLGTPTQLGVFTRD